jgi:hypothetical protein
VPTPEEAWSAEFERQLDVLDEHLKSADVSNELIHDMFAKWRSKVETNETPAAPAPAAPTPEAPKYLLRQPFWSAPPHAHAPGGQYFQTGSVIEHHGIPNSSMEPLNDAARAMVANPHSPGAQYFWTGAEIDHGTLR